MDQPTSLCLKQGAEYGSRGALPVKQGEENTVGETEP